jgi:hypothetical protein
VGDFRIYGSVVENGIQEAVGSIPISSTRIIKGLGPRIQALFNFFDVDCL